MAIIEGNNINFFQGTKEKLINNLSSMSDNDLVISTDEMQWYLVQIKNDVKTLTSLCNYELKVDADEENQHLTFSLQRKFE